MDKPSLLKRLLLYVVLIGGSLLMLIPLAWMLLTSLKTFQEVITYPPVWIPHAPQWQNYVTVLKGFSFYKFFVNSTFVTVMVIAGTIFSSCSAAYAFAFYKIPYKNWIFAGLLGTMMLPGQVTVIPLFKIFVQLGWINTYLPLIVPAWFGTNVFAVFLLRQFFRTIPFSYIEAARVEGASEFMILWRLVVPMSMPIVLTITVFTFLWSWNDLFGPLIYLHSEELYTMPIGLLYFIAQANVLQGGGAQGTPWQLVMTLATVMVLPIIVIFFIVQKRFIAGLTSAGVKG